MSSVVVGSSLFTTPPIHSINLLLLLRRLRLNPTTTTPKTSHFLLPKIMMPCTSSNSKCTFNFSSSLRPTFHIIFGSSSSFLPSRTPKWSCKACTFLNPYQNTSCEICCTSHSSFKQFMGLLDDNLDASVLHHCSKRKNQEDPVRDVIDSGQFRDISKTVNIPEDTTNTSTYSTILKVMTYNVWFREDLEMRRRMKAIGDLIRLHSPDIICFQEVTPDIYDIFQQSSWWKSYSSSVSSELAETKSYFCMQLSKLPVKSFGCKSFGNSIMGRELCIAEIEAQVNKPLVVATTHLESPCPGPPRWDQMYSKERINQAKEALDFLKKNTNVIFCGDMNWDDKSDGPFPLPEGWVDAWAELKPGEIGWTYDTKSNLMLSGNRTLQRRLDRFVCRLLDFQLNAVEMIGTEAIPGVFYCKDKKVKNEMRTLVLPVLPSDHYGLLLSINKHPVVRNLDRLNDL